MSQKLYEENNIRDIASAIREQNGTQDSYTVAQMGNAVRAIKTQPDLEVLNAAENGNYLPSAGKDGFSSVNVNVPDKQIDLEILSATQNGHYVPSSGKDGFSAVDVAVPSGQSSSAPFALPSDYEMVPSIIFDQNSFIDIPMSFINANCILYILAEANATSIGSNNPPIVACAKSSDKERYLWGAFYQGKSNHLYSFYASSISSTPLYETNNCRPYIYKGQKPFDGNFDVLQIGATNYNGYRGSIKRVTFMQYDGSNIYSNGLCDLVACRKKATQELGFYDTFNSTFYTNQGTGTWTVGT